MFDRAKISAVVLVVALGAYTSDAAAGLKGSPADPALVTACLTIDASGFYQLDQDIVLRVPLGAPCVNIVVDNVVFEMFGFGITGAGGGASDHGIHIDNVSNVQIKNGTISGFGGDGVANTDGAANSGHTLVNVTVHDNGDDGIELTGPNNLIANCVAKDNVDDGLVAWENSVIRDSSAVSNDGRGIVVGFRATVTGNTSLANGENGISNVNTGAIITENKAVGNGGSGFDVNTESIAMNNIAVDNLVGMNVNSRSIVKGNIIDAGTTGSEGMEVGGEDNVIEENLITNFDGPVEEGIVLLTGASGNWCANNRFSNNTENVRDLDAGLDNPDCLSSEDF